MKTLLSLFAFFFILNSFAQNQNDTDKQTTISKLQKELEALKKENNLLISENIKKEKDTISIDYLFNKDLIETQLKAISKITEGLSVEKMYNILLYIKEQETTQKISDHVVKQMEFVKKKAEEQIISNIKQAKN